MEDYKICGIVGMVTSNSAGFFHPQKKIFSSLLWADTLRGEDSTGVFGVNKYGNIDYLKTTGHAGNLVTTKEYQNFEDDIFSDYHMVVGHNRKATRGTITDENAHPFVEGNTILVHNGTLTNHKELTKQDVDVDSHAILHSIVERGYEETLKDIQGAFTLVWYNTDDKTLRIIRNDQRPLYIAATVGAWYFASEEGMLQWILGREDEKIEEMTECVPGTLYSFKLEDKENMWYESVDLWSPLKSAVSNIKLEKTEKETKEDLPYENQDFKIGTNILILGKQCTPLTKANQEGYDHILFGQWYVDPRIEVKVWGTTDEVNTLEADIDDDASDSFLFQAKIMCVMTKKGKVILICKGITPYKPILDTSGKELLEDEFMFTDKLCSYCSRQVSFDEIKNGVFKYTSATDFEIICEHCLDKGVHLPQ